MGQRYSALKDFLLFTKYKSLLTIFSLLIFSSSFTYAQVPTWIGGTPTIVTTGPTTITVNYGINTTGRVFIAVLGNVTATNYDGPTIRNIVVNGVGTGWVNRTIIPITAGNVGSVLQSVLDVPTANKTYTVFIVAENSSGVIQAMSIRLYATTLPCPKIDILTGFTQPVTCVNLNATATFQTVILDPATSGILKGTQWTLDWGDGTTATYTSTTDNNLPPLALRTHTYSTATTCNYLFSNTVRNPCGETRSVQYIAVVHGRDIPSDGDGVLSIVNSANGNSLIQVCEGTQSIITLRDNSTWNCQNPTLPGGLTPVPNLDTRNIEWVYGRDPAGAVYNTITGTVNIASLGSAPQVSGRMVPSPYGPNSLSQAITIPASARAGQYFRVYLKNWNKCNWGDPEYVATYVDIQVVAAPPAPTVPGRRVCFGADRTLSVTSIPAGTISWYRDAALTNLLGTGTSFVPPDAAPGTYTYYATDRFLTGIQCQSAGTPVTLTIDPLPQKPTITHPAKNDICYDSCNLEKYTMTANPFTPPAVTSYQWFRNGVAIPGETNASITLCMPQHTGSYTVAAVGPAPSFCLGPQSDPWYVTVHTLSNLSNPIPVVICQGQNATFSAWTTDMVQTWQWEVSTNGGASFTTVGNGPPYTGFNTPNLTLTNPPPSFSGYLYRVEIKTPPGQGGCWFKSKAASLTIDVVPTANAGPAIALCTTTPTNPIYMTGTTTTGTYASAVWTGGVGLGTWTQNTNPALAYFTPTTSNGSFTATLTVRATTSCGGMVITRTRTISWSQTPAVEAGPDISRCSSTPLASITMTGASASGTYSGLTWSGGAGLGTWSQNANPALARFTPTSPSGSFTATLRATGSNACAGTNPTDTRTITWGQTPVADAGPDIGRCSTTPLAPIAMTSASASGTYSGLSWSGGAGLGSWSQNANPALATFTPNVNNGSFVATLTVTGSGACSGNTVTDTRLVEWSYAATVNAGPDQGICAAGTATLAGSIGGAATSATWSGGAGTFTPNNTTLNAVYTPTGAERAAQSVTLTLTTNDPAGICPAVSDQVTISIGTMPTAAVLTSSGDACFNAGSSWMNVAITGGGDPYRISYTLNGSARPDITPYFNNTQYSLGILPAGTYTIAVTQIRDNCGNILSGAGINPVTFQIYQNPVANAGGDQAFCGVLTANLAAVPSIGIGTWSVVSGPGTITFSPNVNNPNATITATQYGSYVLRWTEVNGGICTSSNDKAVLFERTANAGVDRDLCGTLSVALAGNAPAVGQGTWTRISGPGTASFTPTPNTPNATATVSAYGSYVFRWTLRNGVFCNTTDDVAVVYNPAGQVTKPADMFVCNGSTTPAVTFTTTNTGGTTTYAWTNNNISIGLAASGSGNLPSFIAANPGSSPVTATITVTPTFTNGSTVCPGPPVTFTITVNPNGQVVQPANRIACENSTVTVNFTTGNTGGTTTYNWTNSNTSIGLPATGSGNISFTATNTSTLPLTGTITLTPVFSNGGTSCTGTPVTFTITVNPEGQVNDPPDMVICNGSAQNIVFTTNNTGGLTTYNWTNTNTAIGLGANGTGNLSFNATNTGSSPITATITVSPSFNNGSVDCQGPSQTFTIRVNPTPVLSSPLTIADICSNTTVTYNPTSTTAGTTFNWTRAVVAGITPAGPASGTNNPNETLRNLTNIPIGVTYQYTLTANGCSNTQNVIVTVKPEPVIESGQTSNVCSDNPVNHHINLVNFSNPSDNVTFTWPAPVLNPVNPAFSGGTARTSASIQNISDVFTNRTGLLGTATYTVTPYKDGCAGAPQTIVIVVRPEPVLDPGLNNIVCSNTPIGLILREAAGSVTIDYYNISDVQLEAGLSADPGNAVISNSSAPSNYLANDRYLNITGVNKTVTYTIQPFKAPDCYGDPVNVVITIRPQPYVLPAQIKSVCSGIPIGMEIMLSPANVPAGTLFSWPEPTMSDASVQGTAGDKVPADPAGKIHINDAINNTSGAPITATYNITPVSAQGCPGLTIPVIITVNPEPLPKTISGRDKICIGETNLVYNVTPVSGSTFHWTVDPAVGTKTFDFNTNAIIINAAAAAGTGIISVYETNSYTCNGDPSLLSVQVYTQPSPENISGSADVCAFSTRTYSVTSRAGSTYKWTIPGGAAIAGDPSAASVTVVMGNVGGTISVTETNIAGCVTVHNPLSITVRPLPSANISGGATICEGGTIPLNVVFAGTSPYTFTYAVNGVAQTPVTTSSNPYVLNATLAGTYTIVNVTDATGCTNTGTGASLVSYYIRPTATITGGGEICRGASSVVTFVFTGTAPFTFTYNDGTTNLTVPNYANSVYNLVVTPNATSTYTLVSLTDGHSCNGTISGSATVTVNNPPALTLTPTNLTCYNDNTGAVNLSVTGNSPFGFSWTGPAGFTANTEDISGLRAGTYNVTVTDTKGCFSAGSVTLTEPGPINATLNYTEITCFGAAEGEIEISLPIGGSGIYEYSINGGTTWLNTGNFTGLNPGTFDVRIRDAMSPACFRILNGALVLTGPAQLNANVVSNVITCYGANNGSIVISSPSGGFGTYGYSVDGGSTWQGSGTFTNLAPGTYDVRIRDAVYQYCFRILNPAVVITEPPQLNAAVASTNISCFGSTDGTITISAPSGGHGTFEYSINGGGSWQSAGNYNNLGPGTYNVQIRDAAYPGCYRVLNSSLLITQPAVLRAVFTSTMITCFGADDGTISITGATGGTGSFGYSVDGGANWQSSGLFTGLGPGSYDVRIRDAATPACEIILNSGVDITEPPALSGTVVKYDITCSGASDGRITITNSLGGYGSYEYTINGGSAWQTSNQFTGLSQGTYNVQMRDRSRTGCVLILDPALVINEPAVLAATAAGTNVSCFNANDGIITFSGESGGSGSYQYSINGGTSWQGSSSFINLAPGAYDVRLRDAVNTSCYLILNPNLVITEPSAITALVQSTNISCNGANDGTITISSPSGGYGTYEYSINGSSWQPSGNFTALTPGFYSVQIRDAAHTGCITILNGSLRITEPAALRATLQSTNVTCSGANDGIITITSPSGGYGTYEYSINGGTSWFSSGSFTGLPPATYDVRIRDAAQPSCVVILNNALVITAPAALNANVTSANVTCFGAGNGTISVTNPSGGYGTYEFTVDGGTNWSASGSFTNLIPGTYDVRMRDAAHTGCERILNGALVITEPAILNATVAGTAVTCYGAGNGAISITNPSGGYGTYEYSINGGGSWQSSGLFTGLVPGNYNVRIRDAANITCVIVLNNALQITQPPVLNATVSAVMVTCNGASDGQINITSPSGGYGTYEYSINGGGSWQSANSFSNLAPGIYDVRIRDAANISCVIILNNALPVTQPVVMNAAVASTNVTCFGADDGSITIANPTGGYGTYEYSLDGVTWQVSGSFQNLAPGTYSPMIRDRANILCVIVLNPSLSITEPAVLSASLSSTDITCHGSSDGTITISGVSGGYGTYQYSVTGGVLWQPMGTFANLMPGTYDVRIRDAAHPACVIILDPALIISEPPVLNASVASTNVTCFGANDGTITISSPSGGYGTYEYSVDGGTVWSPSGSFASLAPGFYSVRIRDAAHQGCIIVLNGSLRITEPGLLNATVQKTDVSCNGANDGIINITSPSGGYGTYEYSINGGGSWQPAGNYNNLAPGIYDVRIRDAAHIACITILNPGLNITQPAIISATLQSTNVTCNGADNGTITISMPTGGYGTYEYTINGGTTWLTTGNFTGLAPGIYNVQIRDRAHQACITILNPALQITQPAALNASATGTNVTCNGAVNGTITISGATGGYGTYEYSIDGGVSWQASPLFTGLGPGTYNVRIRDAAYVSCTASVNPALVITQPPALAGTLSSTNITCFGANDGTITIAPVSGGYGTYEYTIDGGASWQSSGTYTNLAPGFYNVQIRDAANTGCVLIINSSLRITEPPVLRASLSGTNITCFGANDGTITISLPSGGYGTYEYSINGTTWQSSGNFQNLTPGVYSPMIRDAAQTGCIIILNPALQLIEPAALSATATGTDISCNGVNDGVINITNVSGGYGMYQYTINGGTTWSGSGWFTGLGPGTYNVRVRDAANPACFLTINPALVINEPAALNATVTKTDITCFGAGDGTITISSPAGGYGTYEFTINGGGSWQGSGTFTGLGPGNYNVQMRDAAHPGCIRVLSASLPVTQPSMLNAMVTYSMVTCNGADDGIINITSPTGGYGTYEYSINGGGSWQLAGSFSNLVPGTYDIRIRDAVYINCFIILNSSLTITEPAVLSASVASTNVTCNGAANGTINITFPGGGYGTYEYSINGTTWQSSGLFQNLAPGTYSPMIRDRAHTACTLTLNPALQITQPAVLSAVATATNITCYGANNGIITISGPLGGYGTYAYSINGGTSWQTSETFNNLSPGTYDVRIRDAANPACTAIINPSLPITQPAVLSAVAAGTNVTCYGASDGMITITSPAGGYGTYEYTINGGIAWQASGTFTSLAPGYYNVQIRDAAYPACAVILNSSLRITEPAILAAVVNRTNITCFGSNDGTITISGPAGGYGTYEYSISGGTTWSGSGSFTNLLPGNYDVRIRDAANPGCYIILNPQLAISEPAILNATVTGTDVTCYGATDGRIQITNPSGGSGSYLYSINGGTSWQGSGTFNNLPVGTYDVRIRDAATPACIITLNPSLSIAQPPVLNAQIAGTNITCFGGNDGTITISNPLGGHGTYEFSINGGGSWQPSGSFVNLTPGSYNILVRDAAYQGCIIVLNSAYVLTQPGMLSASVSKTDVSCRGNNDGTISITSPAGGYGTYEYSINGGTSWQTSGNYTNVAPGTYDIRIRDAANTSCLQILYPNLIITEPLTLSMSTTGDVTLDCYDDHDGMGTFYVYGGTMPYTFLVVSNTTGGTVSAPGFNSLTFYNAGTGTVVVSVVDYNGCSAQATINVNQPALLTAGSIGSDQVVCFGDNPASLTETTAPSGGPGTYQYQWQYSANAAGPFMNIAMATSATYTPSSNATYTLYYRRMVTSGLCSPAYSNVVEILVNPLPVALLTGGQTICPGQSSVLRVNLPAGTGPFSLDIENLGTVNNYVSGNDIIVTPSATTTYRLLRVRDANNCEVNAPSANLNGTATVIVSTLPSITSFTPSPAICEYSLAKFEVTANGTNVTYQWFVNEGSGFVPVADGGTYFGAMSSTLQIFNSVRTMNGYVYHVVVSGCGNSVTSPDAVFTVNTSAEIIQMPQDTTICMGQDAAFEADAQGTSVTWQWFVNKGAGFIPSVDDAYISGSNTRTLTITNAQGSFNNWYFRATATGICGSPTSTNLAVLRVLTPPAVTLQPTDRTLCEGGNTSFQANGRGYLSMQWQVYSGGVWTDLNEDATYLGTGSQVLNIVNVTTAMNGNQYRLALRGSCMTIYSDPATLTVNANPVVDFSAVDPVNACGDVPIVLNGNPSGGSGTYTQHNWTGEVGPLSNYYTQTPTFNTMIAGDYELNYRVTDSNGCSASGDLTVRVDKPSARFTQDINFGCTPLDVTFTKDMTGIASWWWDFGDGSPLDSFNANPQHTFSNSSTGSIEYYDVKLRVQSVSGCYDEYTSTITVFPGVDATFAPNSDIICSGSPLTFTAVPGAGRYFWDFGDGVSGYMTNVSNHIYINDTTVPVVRTVTLITTSFYNCTDIKTYDITVMPVPRAQFTADPVTQVYDPAGTQVTFTNATNDGTWNWLWKFGDSSTSNEENPVHQYGDVGTYYITLIASNSSCTDSITHFITIVPPPPVAMFDTVPSGCAPLYIELNNTSLNTDVPGTTYRWSFGDGSTSTAENPTYTYFTPGDYRIDLTVTGPGGVSVMSRIVRAYPSPKAYFELTPDKVYVNDVSVRFFNLSQGATSYLWDFGDGDTSKVREPFHKYMEEGVFDVSLWAYSENGCSDQYILSPAVTVLPVGDIRYPTVFTPNKTGPIERTDLPTGGTEVDQFFYPPIRQKVENYKLQIFNRWGVLIFESHDINVPWNGYYKGELCQQGVYVWLVEGKYQDGKPFKMVGNVTLLH